MMLALASAIVAPSALAQPAPGMEVPGVRGLLDQFQSKQSRSTKRVIVLLNESSLSGQPATGPAVRALPRNLGTIEPGQLQRANQRLAQKFSALRLPSLRPLQGLPIATVEVTPSQLMQLANSGEFALIVEDRLSPPTLAESGPIMRVNAVHSRGFRGAGRTVAILDTGVETNHPFLNGRVVEGACFSSNVPSQGATSVCPGGGTGATTVASSIPCTIAGCDHGTHVAGIAAGRATGAVTFNGVAPDANIMSVQVFSRFTDVPGGTPSQMNCANNRIASPCVLTYSSDQIQGLNRVNLRRAALSITSANLSLGGGQFTTACDTDPLKPIIDTLLSNGVATVIASGNSGFTNAVGSPGCISTAVTVGSTTDSDQISSFTNMSNQVDLLATGSAIQSSITGGGFGNKSGTSMATPQVTGAIAVLSSVSPGTPIGSTISTLISTGVPITDTRTGGSVSKPRMNLEAAVNSVVSTNGSIWRFTGTPCSGSSCPGWQRLDNNPASVRIAAGGSSLYQLHNSGRIWRFTGVPCAGASCPGWELLDTNPATIGIWADGSSLYQLHNNGRIWRYTGRPCVGASCPGWEMLDNNPATLALTAGGGKLYQLHNTGRIWEFTGVPCSGSSCPGWKLLDVNPATVAIRAGGGKLFQLHNSGLIWEYTGVSCTGASCPGWKLLDNNPATLAITAGNQLFQLHNSGRIWRSTGAACSGASCPGWTILDNNPASLQLQANGEGLYQLHNTGRIWQSTGIACNGTSCPGWTMLDNNPATGRITSSGTLLYQIHGPRTPFTRSRVCHDCR